MDLPENLTEPIFERVEAYIKTTLELSRLKAIETGVAVATATLSSLIVALMALLFVFVLSIGVALYLGNLLGKAHYGFYIVASFYLLAGLTLHFFLHKWIRKPLGNFIISQTLK
jgi:hypothetical protein